jgi:beta-galactosidase
MFIAIFFTPTNAKRSFTIDYTRNTFVKDGRDFRFISGTIHHYQVPHKLWLDRLTKLRAMG